MIRNEALRTLILRNGLHCFAQISKYCRHKLKKNFNIQIQMIVGGVGGISLATSWIIHEQSDCLKRLITCQI